MRLIYRVVQMDNGWFKCQYRFFFFWWVDSMHRPSPNKEEQISFATPKREPKTVRVVWP